MHKTKYVLEYETHNLLSDFEIQREQLIYARPSGLLIVNKKKKRTCRIVNFALLADHRLKLKEREKNDKYLELARDWKKNCRTWK